MDAIVFMCLYVGGLVLQRGRSMLERNAIAAAAVAAMLAAAPSMPARAFDESRYPDFKGQWVRMGSPNWVQPKDLPVHIIHRAREK